MLKVWLRQGALYLSGLVCWTAILFLFALVDRVSEGRGEPWMETLAFSIGMWFASQALSFEARTATEYFAGLPLDSSRARRLTLDAGLLWLLALILVALAFEYCGPAKALVRELSKLGFTRYEDSRSRQIPAIPVPSLDRLAMPVLGFWITTTVMLTTGHLRGALRRLLDLGLLLPILVVIAVVALAKSAAFAMHPGWPSWTRVVLPGSVEMLLAAWLAYSCARRINRHGTELATRGVRA